MRFKLFAETFLLFAFLAIINSCGDNSKDVKSNIIPRETMIEILADLQIFESAHQILKDKYKDEYEARRKAKRYPEIFANDSLKKVDKDEFDLYRIYKWVFVNYEVSEQSFRESMDYYSNDPEEFETMYDEVLIRISEKQAESTSS